MALAALILTALAASVLVVSSDASNTKTTSSGSKGLSFKQKWYFIKDNPSSCPANEEVRCVNQCPPEKTCETRDIEYDCAPPICPCQNKCVCKEGYYRNYLGTCISNKECDKCTGDNEFFACDSFCDNECCKIQKQNRTNCPIKTIDCVRQCYCKDGFARDKDENCVPVEECPTPMKCPANEEVCCVNKCPPELNCKTRHRKYKCPAPVDPCENKCVCKKGYYRNFLGTCIPEDECHKPPSCPANEEVRCVNQCPPEKTCETRDIEYDCAPPVCPCQHKCVCKEGFYRNYLGTCISNKECDKCTGDNEFFACDSFCDNECCKIQKQNRTNCPIKTIDCVRQCYCKDGFARDKDENCVPVEKCPTPMTCPANEEVRCVNKCPPELNCKTRHRKYKCPAPVDPCENKCVCKKGYYRNLLGTCIPEDECQKPPSCPAYEEVRCVNQCPPEKTCETRDIEYDCTPPVDPCQHKCVCKEGYYRNYLGTCISNKECDKCTGDNEFFACDSFCDNECCKIQKQNRTNCPIKTIDCVRQCFCKDGFARDKDENCVPVEECPIPMTCPAKEEVRCVNKCPPELNCKTRHRKYKCSAPVDPCENKCVCKKGYYRNSLGTCIPEDECHIPPSCSANEEVRCVNECPPEKTCETRDIEYDCMPPVRPCQHKCVCKDGYFRNYLGTCISNKKCDKCIGNNEFFACDSFCDNECSKILTQNRTNCPIETFVCVSQCFCKDGFARDKDQKCVPVENCPVNTCPANEEYVPCIQGVCRAMNCSQKGEPVPCPDRQWPEEECDAGCICKENYLRNEEGTCVPEDQCETYLCPSNEEYNCCTQALCRPQKCANRYEPQPCPTVESSACKKGCVCKQDYFRNVKGKCVTDDECVDKQCPNPNEKYALSRQPKCPALGTCTSIVARIRCNKPESLGCICKSGFLRDDDTSVCIPICECPQLASAPECQ